MRYKRTNRKTKDISPIILIFYCGSIECSKLPQKGHKFHVNNVADIKRCVKSYSSFDPKKDVALLFMASELSYIFIKELPKYIQVRYVV